MAVRKIIEIGDDGLRKTSHPVEKFDKKLHNLLDDMAETMMHADGAGIAAPQVGILRRVVVIDAGEGILELVNPTITSSQGEQINPEGCLSIPGRRCTVMRPQHITLKAQDRNGEWFEMEGEDFFPIVVSHELDHLDGILYVDKMIEDVTDQLNQQHEEEDE
ncbi:peptide deformylase [Eubacteriales bacterium OttesenSCG-928-N13]|nr:peptide deformylase [Eubacteriales bacterium OttesenSCG-928-N13]